MFVSAHYTGETVVPNFKNGEPWKKVLGPVFIYLNKIENGKNTSLLWEDAKKKVGNFRLFANSLLKAIIPYYDC